MDRKELIQKQVDYCKTKNLPFFMPPDGYCYNCKKDILIQCQELLDKELITGCPYCHRSFCD
jgi:hypothetical protein